MSKNGQQPSPGLGAAEAVHRAERPDKRVLYQVLGVRGLASQGQCDAVEDGDLRDDVVVEPLALLPLTCRVGHANRNPLAIPRFSIRRIGITDGGPRVPNA